MSHLLHLVNCCQDMILLDGRHLVEPDDRGQDACLSEHFYMHQSRRKISTVRRPSDPCLHLSLASKKRQLLESIAHGDKERTSSLCPGDEQFRPAFVSLRFLILPSSLLQHISLLELESEGEIGA